MRRAALALLLIALPSPSAQAAKPEGPVDAIGMLDYRNGPRFKVGDWVRYRTHGESAQGYKTDYTVTVLIAGEELWWGEECFWVETRTSYSGQAPEIAASLLSFAVFQDTLPEVRFRRYIRKFLDGVDAEGKPLQTAFQRAPHELTQRDFAELNPAKQIDTIGVEKVEVPMEAFDALRVRQVYRESRTQQVADSTIYFELIEDHSYWWSDQIPITRLVRLDQENTQRRRVWRIGESDKAPIRIAEHTLGSTQLLGFGSGMKSASIPERLQRPLREQRGSPPRSPPGRRTSGRQG